MGAGRRAFGSTGGAALAPPASSGRHTWSVPAMTALRRKSARRPCSSLTAPPANDCANPAGAPTPPLIASEAKWSSSTTSVRRTPGSALTASYASATIRNAKLGAQKYVGSRSLTCASPSPETVHKVTKPSEVMGSSSSGSRTVRRAASSAFSRGGDPPDLPLRSARAGRPAVADRTSLPAEAVIPLVINQRSVVPRGRLPRVGRQLEFRRHLDVVERRRVQAKDLP